MVRDGIYYALACFLAAAIVGALATPWLAVVPLLLAAFFLWFFRDPERRVPDTPGALVSVADGKVTDIATTSVDGVPYTRISIFLSVFNVHVNRAPVSGVVTDVVYRRGQFRNAMDSASAELNEQSICTMLADSGETVIFKQIAGLLARRIVLWPKAGERIERGARVGLIKFGSRCDVIFPASANVAVKIGDVVKGGASLLATLSVGGEHVGAAKQNSESTR